jgi:hypothetical protein
LLGFDVTLIVRGSKGEEVITTVRLRTASAVAKARELAAIGWCVTIEYPNGIRTNIDGADQLFDAASQIVDRQLDEKTSDPP